jgi:hypothetical protein
MVRLARQRLKEKQPLIWRAFGGGVLPDDCTGLRAFTEPSKKGPMSVACRICLMNPASRLSQAAVEAGSLVDHP